MLTDVRSLSDGEVIEADICIIGSGPAGATVAQRLKGAGLRIALLESGGEAIEPAIDELTAGELSGFGDEPLEITRMRVLGGTSTVWNGQCRMLDAIDFETRSWVPESGWPFGLAELGPHYATAHGILRLQPVEYELDAWSEMTKSPVMDLGGSELFHRVSLVRPLDFWSAYGEEFASAPDVAVFRHATVLSIEADPGGERIDHLIVADLNGRRLTARARAYVVACGGLENARLLLLSNDVHGAGLGNANDLVGRYFMEHPRFVAGTLLVGGSGLPSKGLYTEAYIGDGFSIRGDLGIAAETCRREGITNVLGRLSPAGGYQASQGEIAARHIWKELRQGRYPDGLFGNLWSALKDIDVVAGRAYDEVFNEFGDLTNIFELETYIEQSPNPNSRVTLSEERDAFGQPRARLTWDLNELDRHTAWMATELFARELAAAGVGRLRVEVEQAEIFPPDTGWGHHHMGTTRMHDDPRQGVVDSHGKVHGLSNLYVAGSSVFPSSGCATPTLTIVALSVRLAEHLKSALPGVET